MMDMNSHIRPFLYVYDALHNCWTNWCLVFSVWYWTNEKNMKSNTSLMCFFVITQTQGFCLGRSLAVPPPKPNQHKSIQIVALLREASFSAGVTVEEQTTIQSTVQLVVWNAQQCYMLYAALSVPWFGKKLYASLCFYTRTCKLACEPNCIIVCKLKFCENFGMFWNLSILEFY